MNELKLPKVGDFQRNIGRLVKIDAITPPPPETYYEYIFEDTSYLCEVRLNTGETLVGITTVNDFYGIGTGEKTAIKEMMKYCVERHISDISDLEIVVVKVTEQTRMKPTNQENFYAKGFPTFESLPYGSKKDLPEDKEEIVWSSRQFTQEAVDKFIKNHTLPTKE